MHWEICLQVAAHFTRPNYGFSEFIGCNVVKLFLELLEPGRYIWLLKALYGLLMLLPQQSAAFKILRTRLKTVPSPSFNGDQLKRASSGNPYSQILHYSGSQITEDGDVRQDNGNLQNGINFASRLQQFVQMQRQHRMLEKSQEQSQARSSSTLSKEGPETEESRGPQTSDSNLPPSRSSRRGLG
ncbi:protein VAC14-like protein [Gossypium australe]|uniref:Protein VAC14-like protein n=1 Tax=Gossypium australe TaxID=47621 RepID=A0A5B6VAW6_9ROSI|nr:protein VAC14-like protein [Gossypium australe]